MEILKRDMVLGSYRMIEELRRSTEQLHVPSMDMASLHRPKRHFMGIEFCPSPHFPKAVECQHCGGSGEGGEQATYCEKCDGRGAVKYEGMMQDRGVTTLIRSPDPLPKKFAPYFPREIPLHRRPATRSREIPWPQGEQGKV